MTLEEARTIWLTLVGSDWIEHYDLMIDPHYPETLQPAYTILRMNAAMDVDRNQERVRIKCKS